MVNKATVLGLLGRDPESKNGAVKLSVATTEKWTDKQGAKQERTEWHRCTAFGKTGELIAKFFSKGKPIYLEGRLQTSSYDKDGQKHYSTEIIVSEFKFVPGGKGGGSGDGGGFASNQDDAAVSDTFTNDEIPF